MPAAKASTPELRVRVAKEFSSLVDSGSSIFKARMRVDKAAADKLQFLVANHVSDGLFVPKVPWETE